MRGSILVFSVLDLALLTISDHRAHQHRVSIVLLISSGAAKITSARSPIIPAATSAGTPFCGPSFPASVFKRRLRSQNARVLPSAVVTRYVSRQYVIVLTSMLGSSFFRLGSGPPPIIPPIAPPMPSLCA